MGMKLKNKKVIDPTGHNKSLLLHGDWIFVELIDYPYIGLGEATHSGDDDRCIDIISEYYKQYFDGIDYSLQDIYTFESSFEVQKVDRVTGTAISALSQAATDLLA